MANSKRYIDLISQNAKAKEIEQLGFRAEEAELHVQTSILETKKAISTAKRELAEAQSAIPYDLQKEIDATTKVKELEEGLALAETIAKERF